MSYSNIPKPSPLTDKNIDDICSINREYKTTAMTEQKTTAEENPEIIHMADSEEDNQVIIDDKKTYIRYDKYKTLEAKLQALRSEVEKLYDEADPQDYGHHGAIRRVLKIIDNANQ